MQSKATTLHENLVNTRKAQNTSVSHTYRITGLALLIVAFWCVYTLGKVNGHLREICVSWGGRRESNCQTFLAACLCNEYVVWLCWDFISSYAIFIYTASVYTWWQLSFVSGFVKPCPLSHSPPNGHFAATRGGRLREEEWKSVWAERSQTGEVAVSSLLQ